MPAPVRAFLPEENIQKDNYIRPRRLRRSHLVGETPFIMQTRLNQRTVPKNKKTINAIKFRGYRFFHTSSYWSTAPLLVITCLYQSNDFFL